MIKFRLLLEDIFKKRATQNSEMLLKILNRDYYSEISPRVFYVYFLRLWLPKNKIGLIKYISLRLIN